MARRIARVVSTLVVAAGLLFGALLILPAALGWQRYVIMSGSMTGTYDRGSLVLDEVVPVAELRKGDVITYRPPAGSGPAGLVTHRIAEITTDKRRPPHLPHQGRRQRGGRPLDLPCSPRASRRACAWACPTSGFALAALGKRDLRLLIVGLPAGLIALQHRRPLAGGRRRRRGGAAMKRAARSCRAARRRRPLGRRRPFPGHASSASSDHAAQTFAASPVFNGVAVSLSDPGTPLRSTVPLSATADLGPLARLGHLPALARRRRHLDHDLRAHRGPVHVLLGQHGRRRRALRPARHRARRLGLLEDRLGRLAPRRQHRPRHLGHRRDAAHRHRHRERDRHRRRQRRDLRRLRRAPLLRRQLDADLHRRQRALLLQLEHGRGRRRRLGRARHRDRRRRQHVELDHDQPDRRQHLARPSR